MKYVLPTLAFSFFLSLCDAQNWAPLNLTDKYNYRLGTAAYITNTLWVDSVTVTGTDSVFHLNRIVTDCDTCQLHWTGQPYKLANQGQYLQKTMTKRPDGWYVFDGKSRFSINPHAELGVTWLFDPIQNIVATVVEKAELTTPFATMDSVKTISLSTGEEFQLSKNHGFITCPKLGGTEVYSLTGIEGRDLGERVPGFHEFYDFEVGDVFMQYDYRGDGGSFLQQESYSRLEIIGKQIQGNAIQFTYNEHLLQINGYNCGGVLCMDSSSTIVSNQIWTVEDLPFFTQAYPNELLKIREDVLLPGVWCTTPYYHVQLGRDSLGILAKTIEDNNNPFQPASVGYDLDGELLVPRDGNADYCFLGLAYKTGLGKTFLSSGFFEYGEAFQLLGYVKGQDTIGIILSDEDLYVNAVKESRQSIQVGLSPNPSQGQVLLSASFPSHESSATLTLFDALGRPVLQKNLQPNGNALQEQLTLDGIPAGVYLVHLALETGTWSGKLMVK
jgi:hypothetical protein